MYPDKKQMLAPHVRGYPRPVYTRPVRYDTYRPNPADPRCAVPVDPRLAVPVDPRVARPVRQIHRSHSSLGYLQRHHRPLHTGQRSQSLNRVSEPQTIEMCTMKQTAVPATKPEATVSGEKAVTANKATPATSSVASSSTVADIVEL